MKIVYQDPVVRERQRAAAKEAWQDPVLRLEQSERMKARWQDPALRSAASEATKERWAQGLYDGCYSGEECRQKHSDAQRAAHARGDYGEACREKISKAAKERWQDPEFRALYSGENHRWWRDGTTKDPYPLAFSEDLKQRVRTRDGFTCALCGEAQGNKALDIHHIDRDKQNNAMSNLISLHRSCHQIVHTRGDFDSYRIGFQLLFTDEPAAIAT